MKHRVETPAARKASGAHPGEPLYTKEEIAERLGVSVKAFSGQLSHPRGDPLRVWNSGHVSAWHSRKNLYRLSDARRWWTAQMVLTP